MAVFTIQPVTLAAEKMAYVELGYNVNKVPSENTLNNADAFHVGDSYNNFCTDQEAGTYEYWDDHFQGYIQFDLTGITGTVTSAILSFWGGDTTPISTDVKAVTSSWDKTTITGVNKPTNETTGYGNAQWPTAYSWANFDVTQIVNRMIAGTLVNNGFMVSTHGVPSGTTNLVAIQNAAPTSGSNPPKLVITTGSTTPTISNANIISASNGSLAFVAIPPKLTFPAMAIASSSNINVVSFGFVVSLVFSADIQSSSQVALLMMVIPTLTFIATIAAASSVQLSIQIIVPGYFILKGHVAIGEVPVINANVRVLSDDGSKVFSTTTDALGNYEVTVNTAGIYHMLCYKKDIDGSVYSSIAQPYINVVAV